MIGGLKKVALLCVAVAANVFIPATTTRAVPSTGTAPFFHQSTAYKTLRSVNGSLKQGQTRNAARVPSPIRFREVSGRGLLVSAWVNGSGPYTFAIDTGAGATILSRRVADEARVSASGKRPVTIQGMSGAGMVSGQEVLVRELALGDENNLLPSSGTVIVTDRLAPGVDGVLDPAEAFWPLGFEIDMPRGELTAFDPRLNPVRRNQSLAPDETIVPWLFDAGSRRPFVLLEGRQRALIDTGSGFGLALTEDAARSLGILGGRGREYQDVRDLAGGQIAAHRISPATVHLGNLVLRSIPTDLLPNARTGSPVLLGRDALRPFRLTFDPLNRLIRIIPG
jgi:predicted aspartyl protease